MAIERMGFYFCNHSASCYLVLDKIQKHTLVLTYVDGRTHNLTHMDNTTTVYVYTHAQAHKCAYMCTHLCIIHM